MRDAGENDEENRQLIYREELERQGMIIPWSTQVEVLSHLSVGCFVTHCGWNSTSEILACGVPMVACPQWVDQRTNAKLVEDMWKTGVRANPKSGTIIEGEEIRRCLDLVMGGGEKGEEIRRNAKKWKELAKEAAGEGGSSDKNLRAFLEEIASSV
ncbi:crocetin glucosyltransferase, chloroplastic-like [Punica granatum]|uniref:Crocetin glucosyltransferase, chloroplastic-like n=1 Tax=Punica granatum TaxID=22663 RepID=A0A6P8DF53_PUNGR|nr:crocetin glucosyltransferase, chloroplastic-like [Punica granatum]